MTALEMLLDTFRHAAVTEREKGTYFEELIVTYLRNEATYRDLYSDVWTYAEWADLQGLDKRDTGIDLVAKTRGTDEFHAIQCKLFAPGHKVQKSDIDSFFTASGKKPFTRRIIVATTNHWSEHAEDALLDQQPPVSKIDLTALEESQIDWGHYQPKAVPVIKTKKQLRQHQTNALNAVAHGLVDADRGKLIMACGTGKGISQADGWRLIAPDQHGDWLKQRDVSFTDYIVLGDKKGHEGKKLFANYSSGVKTNRDAWCYNASKNKVETSMSQMIDFYNREVDRYNHYKNAGGTSDVEDFINADPAKISWNRSLRNDVRLGRKHSYQPSALVRSLYRPFFTEWLYFSRVMNNDVAQIPRIFPDGTAANRMIMIKQRWTGDGQLALMVDRVVEMQTDGGAQCFPLYLYDNGTRESETTTPQGGLFDAQQPAKLERKRRDAITDEGLEHFKAAYPGESIVKEDIFYYVYGILHSDGYREVYADNLGKELPRIPCVKTAADFWAFSKAGRKLADLHINYETVEMYPLQTEGGGLLLTDADYRVEKMRYGKNGKDKDLSTLIYNDKITVKGIPPEAYEYVVNGKPALDWVVERQCVKVDKDSGIVNDANDYAVETMNNPRYPLELFQRVVTVSLETMKIVKSLPRLDVQSPVPTVGQLTEAKDTPDALTA
uniref:Helicase domain protein (Modular protein) n=1 Tax=Ralstonia solanacearum TaxID=305 RepID=A0A0S4WUE8_RALSL|nr:Helicase domain protein (modular protein) [Ralstonia solanacearum]